MRRKALEEADVKVDHVYRTPRYNHNAIEPHATIALWDGGRRLTVFDSTQSVIAASTRAGQRVSARSRSTCEVLAPFVGGGFGGKGGPVEAHGALRRGGEGGEAARQARAVARGSVPHRSAAAPRAEQRVALGAQRDGPADGADARRASRRRTDARALRRAMHVSRAASLRRRESVRQPEDRRRSTSSPTPGCARPGESIGTFALESRDGRTRPRSSSMDPIELRRMQRTEEGSDRRHAVLEPAFGRSVPARRGAIRLGQRGTRSRARSATASGSSGKASRRRITRDYRFRRKARVRESTLTAPHACSAPRATRWAWERRPCRSSTPPSDWACRSAQVSFQYGDSTLPIRRSPAARARRSASPQRCTPPPCNCTRPWSIW